jgi:hypothetical protein
LGVTVEIACCDAPGAQWHLAKGMLSIHTLGRSRHSFRPNRVSKAVMVDGQIAERARQYFAQRFHIRRTAERLVEIILKHGSMIQIQKPSQSMSTK